MALLTVESAAFSVLGAPPSQAVEAALARLVTQFRKPRIQGVLRAVVSKIEVL